MSYLKLYLKEAKQILSQIDHKGLEKVITLLSITKSNGGRVFVLGVGGSAATASHLVGDLRKMCGIEAYAPTDNTPEFTAWANDSGWDEPFFAYLMGSKLSPKDCTLIISVGGGCSTVSPGLHKAMSLAKERGATILGIVGRRGGATKLYADAVIIIPPLFTGRITAHTEGIASVLCHLVVNEPRLQRDSL